MDHNSQNRTLDGTMADRLTSKATVVAMIGSPIAHAKSPAIFNRWFAANDLSAMMVPMDIAPDCLADFYRTLRGWSNCSGAVVTAPHKQASYGLMDRTTRRASALEAVNVVTRRPDGSLVGDNVDGDGFVQAMRSTGHDPVNVTAMVFGCGGAGSAVALALADAGAKSLTLFDTDEDRMRRLAGLVESEAGTSVSFGRPVSLDEFGLVINATDVGLLDERHVFPIDTAMRDAIVADIVSSGKLTSWLRAAQTNGNPILTGEDMAQGQFALLASRLGFDVDG